MECVRPFDKRGHNLALQNVANRRDEDVDGSMRVFVLAHNHLCVFRFPPVPIFKSNFQFPDPTIPISIPQDSKSPENPPKIRNTYRSVFEIIKRIFDLLHSRMDIVPSLFNHHAAGSEIAPGMFAKVKKTKQQEKNGEKNKIHHAKVNNLIQGYTRSKGTARAQTR